MIADEFVGLVHKVQDVISLSSLAFDDEERKSEVDLDWIWKDNNEAVANNPPPVVAKPPPVVPQKKINSKYIDSEKHFNFIKNKCFGGREFEIKRVYSTDEHAFTGAAFHKEVDFKDDILYVINSEHNRTFGGYFKKQ